MTAEVLVQGRTAYRRRAWGEAYRCLAAANERDPLGPDDLVLLAEAAYLTGRVDRASEHWEAAYRANLTEGQPERGARCAFWLGLTLVLRGEHARGGGWLARAGSAVDDAGTEGAGRGYVRLAAALAALDRGDIADAASGFHQAVAVADSCDDPDLRALGRLGRGQVLLAAGSASQGVAMLDEAMLAVTTGETSTAVAGIIYCAVILACQQTFDVRRAQEWTAELRRWCDDQPDLVPYRGQCLVHRSEVLLLRGAWTEALDEARKACEHLSGSSGDPALGMAQYQRAEMLRLRGEYVDAEEGYRRASDCGHPVQPGLALLRVAQGRVDDAMAAMRLVVDEPQNPSARARMLAAYVEIALAAGDAPAADTAATELAALAAGFDSPYLAAVVQYARGRVLLAAGDATSAVAALRRSHLAWQELDAPYEAATVRVQIARACAALGDNDTAEWELRAARRVFERLGAAPALARTREQGRPAPSRPAGLTPREIQVLRLLATGATNKDIAGELVISDRTVARHVANLFTKLGVTSRSAATAYAYRHGLA